MGKRRIPNRAELMKNILLNTVENKWFELGCRWCLGIVFIYASLHKIVNPADFAKVIYGYKLFPGELINLMAIIVPFIELTCGLALITGTWPRATSIIICGMLLGFIIAISINLIRGHEFDCGCFGFNKTAQSPVGLLIRDIIWFVFGSIVICYKSERKFSVTE